MYKATPMILGARHYHPHIRAKHKSCRSCTVSNRWRKETGQWY